MSEKKLNQSSSNEVDLDSMEDVSGGAVTSRKEKYGFLNLKKRTVYDVTRDDTGEKIKTYRDVTQATNLDRRLNRDFDK